MFEDSPMSTSAKVREPKPIPQTTPTPVAGPTPPVPAPVRFYWGDRFLFLFWLACAVLLVLMHVFDTLAGLLRR